MEENYKLNIYTDNRDRWTYSSLAPFLYVNPLYIKSTENNFMEKIFNILIEIIFCDYENDHDNDIIHEFLIKDGDISFDIKNNKSDILNFLLLHNDLCIFQKQKDKYWERIYIQLEKTNFKCCYYTDDEIKDYIISQQYF